MPHCHDPDITIEMPPFQRTPESQICQIRDAIAAGLKEAARLRL